jgi:hypothetical protein
MRGASRTTHLAATQLAICGSMKAHPKSQLSSPR